MAGVEGCSSASPQTPVTSLDPDLFPLHPPNSVQWQAAASRPGVVPTLRLLQALSTGHAATAQAVALMADYSQGGRHLMVNRGPVVGRGVFTYA